MDLRQVFAVNLRRLRNAKKLSQEELAHQTDIDRTYISKLERGGSYVGLEIIGKLADILGVQAAEFLKPTRGKRGERNE